MEKLGSDSEWTPPTVTEQEKLEWQARQKQRERLSNAMGQYLLKGYRMLGSNCRQCGNILLRAPRDDVDFCIQCEELGRDQISVTKGRGVALSKTADSTPTHDTILQTMQSGSSMAASDHSAKTRTVESEQIILHKSQNTENSHDKTDVLTQSDDALVSKLAWATKELSETSSVEYSTQLCVLIKEGVDALKRVREFAHSNEL